MSRMDGKKTHTPAVYVIVYFLFFIENSAASGHFLCYHKNIVIFCHKRTDLLSDNCFGLPTSYPAEILKCSFQDLSGAFDVREQARF